MCLFFPYFLLFLFLLPYIIILKLIHTFSFNVFVVEEDGEEEDVDFSKAFRGVEIIDMRE